PRLAVDLAAHRLAVDEAGVFGVADGEDDRLAVKPAVRHRRALAVRGKRAGDHLEILRKREVRLAEPPRARHRRWHDVEMGGAPSAAVARRLLGHVDRPAGNAEAV